MIVGERVWGARRGEVGGDEWAIVASVALNAHVPTACVGVDEGLRKGQGVVHKVEMRRILRPAQDQRVWKGERLLSRVGFALKKDRF